jgi:imidazolonepropionase-like amidohydrolase
VELGLAKDRALRALTLDAARILGVSGRMGSIAKGKDADFLVFDGDPFEPSSRLLNVIMDGKLLDPNK